MLKRFSVLVGLALLASQAWAGISDFDAGASLVSRGFFLTWIVVFLAGVLVSFTPCVYPMIPITLSIIGARSAEQKPLQGFARSLVFVLGLAVVYTALGFIGAKTGKLVGFMLQNKWFLGFLTVFFLAMGASMLGLFEIQMPPSLASRLQGKAGRGGYVGAFLLGVVTGVVASPCGSPVLFSVLTLATQSGQELVGMALLFAYALGIGMLFLVLGTFPAFLRVMPKSGDWMEDIRIFLGLALIAVAVGYYAAFLMPATVHLLVCAAAAGAGAAFAWLHARKRLARRGLRGFWITLSAFLAASAIYAGSRAITTIEHSSAESSKASTPGLAPAATTAASQTASSDAATTAAQAIASAEIKEATSSAEASAESDWLTDEAEGLRLAREQNRPVIIDFRADWCAACKELERKTFPHPEVAPLLSRFVKVKIDATEETDENAALRQKYGALALPTVVLIRSDGSVAQELTLRKFEEPAKFAQRLRKFLGQEAGQP